MLQLRGEGHAAEEDLPELRCTMRGSKGDLGWVDEMEAIDAFFED